MKNSAFFPFRPKPSFSALLSSNFAPLTFLVVVYCCNNKCWSNESRNDQHQAEIGKKLDKISIDFFIPSFSVSFRLRREQTQSAQQTTRTGKRSSLQNERNRLVPCRASLNSWIGREADVADRQEKSALRSGFRRSFIPLTEYRNNYPASYLTCLLRI